MPSTGGFDEEAVMLQWHPRLVVLVSVMAALAAFVGKATATAMWGW